MFNNIFFKIFNFRFKPLLRKSSFIVISLSNLFILKKYCFLESKKITFDEIKKHNQPQKGVWVSYEGKVYDITEFIDSHPGGSIILQASGKDLGPFFKKFSFHKSKEILAMLEQYYIGDLDGEIEQGEEMIDEFINEPTRDPNLVINSNKPFNAETPIPVLIENFFTPNEKFFVRNHMPVPTLHDHEVKFCFQDKYLKNNKFFIEEKVENNIKKIFHCVYQNIEDLKDFEEHEYDVTIQCTGNRRSEMNAMKAVSGLNWKGGAIGTAKWKGARIKNILESLGFKIDTEDHVHVRFIGADHNSNGEHYEASVPLRYAVQKESIFAFYMNDDILPRDHGYPIRAIIPGVTGARNVKWVSEVYIVDDESQSRWQQEDYRCYSPDKVLGQKFQIDVPAIHEMPVTSLICLPENGSTINKNEKIGLKGYAYCGGGRGIARVEVSCDGGVTWIPANLSHKHDSSKKVFSWLIWDVEIPIPSSKDEVEIICKAVDVSYNHQPESPLPIWNMRGLLNNSWHKINLKIN